MRSRDLSLLVVLVGLLSIFGIQGAKAQEEEENFIPTIPEVSAGSKGRGIFGLLFKDSDHEDYESTQPFQGNEAEVSENEKDMLKEGMAKIRILDKTLGKLYNVDIEVGQRKSVRSIIVKVDACLRPSYKTIIPEGRALLEIWEVRGRVTDKLFKGWMYAQSPSASQFIHPKYDVTVASCVSANTASR